MFAIQNSKEISMKVSLYFVKPMNNKNYFLAQSGADFRN
jgi:hypothetical protein